MPKPAKFKDRTEAGHALAKHLYKFQGQPDLVVVAIPRGGVPVAKIVADSLGAPLEIFIVRKLGVPNQPELAFGAISSGGNIVINQGLFQQLEITKQDVDRVLSEERAELERREKLYRGDKPRIPLKGKTVILVDDGLATGASMKAAISGIQKQKPSAIIVAVPVAPIDTCEALEREFDCTCSCPTELIDFGSVGMWYENFSQVSDKEVKQVLMTS